MATAKQQMIENQVTATEKKNKTTEVTILRRWNFPKTSANWNQTHIYWSWVLFGIVWSRFHALHTFSRGRQAATVNGFVKRTQKRIEPIHYYGFFYKNRKHTQHSNAKKSKHHFRFDVFFFGVVFVFILFFSSSSMLLNILLIWAWFLFASFWSLYLFHHISSIDSLFLLPYSNHLDIFQLFVLPHFICFCWKIWNFA